MQRLRVPDRRGLGAVLLLAVGAAIGLPLALSREGHAEGVSFARQIQPIFDAKCAVCHPTSYEYLDLRRGRAYEELVHVPSALQPAFERVLPGRPELSYLLTHVPDPSREGLLTEADRALIERWIREGASDD